MIAMRMTSNMNFTVMERTQYSYTIYYFSDSVIFTLQDYF